MSETTSSTTAGRSFMETTLGRPPGACLGRIGHRSESPQCSLPTHEEAERVAGRVGVDAQRLLLVVRPVEDHLPAQGEHTLVLRVELLTARNLDVEVQLLRDLGGRP